MSSYPDLLFHQPELIVCWHAATSSEKVFKKQYNSFKIKKMNVPIICDKILEIVTQPRRKRTTHRCSLYLFSQLMCGVTKLHKYQIEYYQKEVSELEEKIHPPLRPEPTIREDEEPPEIQLPTSQDSLNIISDLHTFQDDDHDNMIQRMIEMNLAARQDFGVLTDEQLVYMFDHIKDVSLDSTMETEQVADLLKEKNVTDMTAADVVISEEIRQERQQSQEFCSPELLSKSRRKSRIELTPQKRLSQIQVETPTKRTRLIFDRDETAAGPSETVPTELPMEVEPPSALILSEKEMQQPDLSMELKPLDTVFMQTKKSKKKQKVFDKTNSLKDEKWLYTQWRENPNIHCEDLKIPSSRHLTSPIKLLRQPATELFTRWGRDLQQLFSKRAKPCAFPSKDREDIVSLQQVIRAEETTSILATEELSALGKTQTAIIADSSSRLYNVSNVPSININLTDLNIIPETRETIAPTPEIPLDMINLVENINITEDEQNQQIINANIIETETSLEDIDMLLKKQSPLKMTTSLSSSPNSQPSLTIHDILAMLQVLWQERPYVTLNDLISRDTYSTEDVATAFEILLELHKQKKAVLLQRCCYDTLYIKDPQA
ncbi:uncharacterized protein LOC109858591 isoform X2 [Pseudomyrmex gracilis]|uniref:uncharacterized protein LOC109858591 isoform X2 n=1 Tax=Pseudomyrmex gracilis TaxID=219809 RepID=UPI00099548C2|nr:uncharacterized protein LOC109858591 isoform X2 [Pseudomyrmex gracilis]